MSAPDILDAIKEDLGIADDESDEWLVRRIAGVWSRMENYTSRALASPPVAFVDDWSRMVRSNPQQPLPPSLYIAPRASVFLRHFPVASIEAVEIEGGAADPAAVRFDAKSGKLFTLTGTAAAEDLSAQLFGARTKITYKAGWATIPGDLYEMVLASVQQAWAMRAATAAGAPGGLVTSINVVDVGSLDVTPGGSAFQQATMKGGMTDPMLGPYTSVLDLYVDHRSLIGSPLTPVTELAAPVPP